MEHVAGAGAIDWMEWAVRVRERADRDRIDVHAAWGLVRIPDAGWRSLVTTVGSVAGVVAPEVAERWFNATRERTCRLASTLVGVRVKVARDRKRAVAV